MSQNRNQIRNFLPFCPAPNVSIFGNIYVKCFFICTISKKRCTIRKMQTKSLGVIYRGNIYTLYYVIVLSLLSTSSSSSPSLSSSSSSSSSSSTTTLTDALPTDLTSYSIRLVDTINLKETYRLHCV